MSTFPKDPDAVLDYVYDWAPWLAAEETIDERVVTVTGSDGELAIDTTSATDDAVTVWLSGGTHGVKYRVACLIITSAGRTDERTFTVSVRNR